MIYSDAQQSLKVEKPVRSLMSHLASEVNNMPEDTFVPNLVEIGEETYKIHVWRRTVIWHQNNISFKKCKKCEYNKFKMLDIICVI